MSEMSPLRGLILRVMRTGAIWAAGFVALVIGIEIWKRWRFGGFGQMAAQDVSFFGVLAVMLAGALWLARSIGRELRKPGSDSR